MTASDSLNSRLAVARERQATAAGVIAGIPGVTAPSSSELLVSGSFKSRTYRTYGEIAGRRSVLAAQLTPFARLEPGTFDHLPIKASELETSDLLAQYGKIAVLEHMRAEVRYALDSNPLTVGVLPSIDPRSGFYSHYLSIGVAAFPPLKEHFQSRGHQLSVNAGPSAMHGAAGVMDDGEGRRYAELLGEIHAAAKGRTKKARQRSLDAETTRIKLELTAFESELVVAIHLEELYLPTAQRRVHEAVARELHEKAAPEFGALATAELKLDGMWRDALGLDVDVTTEEGRAEVRERAERIEAIAEGIEVRPLEAAARAEQRVAARGLLNQ